MKKKILAAACLMGLAVAGIQESGTGLCLAKGNEESGNFITLPEFETVDLEGNTVTADLFGQKDLTVLNIWATFCGPCIREMPELAAWSEEMPENVQIIGLISDVRDAGNTDKVDYAREIVSVTGVEYTNLIANEDFDEIIKLAFSVPTTLFINKDGELVENIIMGAYVDRYKENADHYLEKINE